MATQYEPGVRVSEYVLEERIGAGTFGEVWRAKHHIWDEQVAIKLPTEPQYVRYLRREGMVVHGLRHPNIVGVKGLDPYGEIPYLIMELVSGPSLRQVIDEHEAGLPIETVQTVLRGVLEAMKVAHQAHVLHRDLKPGNVLLDLDGRELTELTVEQVKVSDFGLGSGGADVLRSIAQSASMDRDDKLVGTLAYMAPELRDGKQQADERSDLYSIGVMLFEMLTGERPVGAETPSTLRSTTPPILDEVFRKLYARHANRYESVEQVLSELTSIGDEPTAAIPPIPPPPPPVGARPVSEARPGSPCPKCRQPTETFDQFCTHCGQQLVADLRQCSSCGAYPGPEDRYCIFCGARLPSR
ncbi:MAG: hypothetical protein D6744_08925 [Planctomycetota bacterium]|nr:MAG: hypothetical protein D6744_08925 [Planctomycetota bacterium]